MHLLTHVETITLRFIHDIFFYKMMILSITLKFYANVQIFFNLQKKSMKIVHFILFRHIATVAILSDRLVTARNNENIYILLWGAFQNVASTCCRTFCQLILHGQKNE
jgi:BarA-like signal transduction histidine kinase